MKKLNIFDLQKYIDDINIVCSANRQIVCTATVICDWWRGLEFAL